MFTFQWHHNKKKWIMPHDWCLCLMHGAVYECTKNYVTVYKIFNNFDSAMNASAKKQVHMTSQFYTGCLCLMYGTLLHLKCCMLSVLSVKLWRHVLLVFSRGIMCVDKIKKYCILCDVIFKAPVRAPYIKHKLPILNLLNVS